MSLKEKQRRQREMLILQAAEEIFAEKGYYDTSIDEVAARVGIAKGTVYLHFASKEALIVAIFTREMEHFLQEVETILASGMTARARLEMVLRSLYTGMHRRRSQLLSNAYNDVDLRHMLMESKSHIHELWERLAASVTTLLEEGKDSSEFNCAMPTKVMLVAFFSLLSSHVSELLVFNDERSTEDFVGLMGSIFFDGITAKKEIQYESRRTYDVNCV
jgi:AcrR family transcriptional regulator